VSDSASPSRRARRSRQGSAVVSRPSRREDVEGIERCRHRPKHLRAGFPNPQPSLQATERGSPGRIEYDDLAVENCLPAAQRRRHTSNDLGKVGGIVVAVSTPHICSRRISFDQGTSTVSRELECPPLPRRGFTQGGEHRIRNRRHPFTMPARHEPHTRSSRSDVPGGPRSSTTRTGAGATPPHTRRVPCPRISAGHDATEVCSEVDDGDLVVKRS
jgi:hypothetical protein